jgi:hypothetical protein
VGLRCPAPFFSASASRGEPIVVARRGRAAEAAREGEVAVDLLVGDEAIEVLPGRLGLGLDRECPLCPEAPVSSAVPGRKLPLVMPPLRVEAPSPGSCLSKTWTERPAGRAGSRR